MELDDSWCSPLTEGGILAGQELPKRIGKLTRQPLTEIKSPSSITCFQFTEAFSGVLETDVVMRV